METVKDDRLNGENALPMGHRESRSSKKMTNKNKWIFGGGFVAAILILVGARYYFYWSSRQDTDDAFIDGHVFMISPSVPGPVIKIYVDDNQYVKKGDPLVEIDPREYEARLSQARAEVAASSASARQVELDLSRYLKLYRQNQISQQAYDHAVSAVDVARANLKLAIQREAAAELDLSYTQITAPSDGYVTKKTVELQNYEQAGAALMAVVSPDVWVTANFKETELKGMKSGDPVDISVDAYPGKIFKGHVDSIQDGSGAKFSLFPPEDATGNYVKVVQRVPVKIVFDGPPSSRPFLAPGMSVIPIVHIK